MAQTNFYGRILSGDIAVVRGLLQSWLRIDTLSEKVKLSGEQLVYETEAVYVYSYVAEGAQSFLLEGHRNAELGETRSWLEELLAACTARSVFATLEYVSVDPDGREISEQYALSTGK